MEDDIDLPPIPLLKDDPVFTPCDPHHARKRPRLEYDVATSSDPALFSSDDHAPTAENYASKRRKDQWPGTWWGERYTAVNASTSTQGKRQFTRNLDSGIWMGSEGTDMGLEDELFDELRSVDEQATALTSSTAPLGEDPNRPGNGAPTLGDVDDDNDQVHHCQPHGYTPQMCERAIDAAVEDIVDRCLEEGDENVDLSSMSLVNVPNASLRRLRGLTKHTRVKDMPPKQETYSAIEPELRIYLSNNSISRLPSGILDLTNLRVLSIRHNELTDLPPGLAKLPRLERVNAAGNKLKHLPYEMLRLYDRADFEMIATPNPFPPRESSSSSSSSSTHPSANPRPSTKSRALFLMQSRPTYFHPSGSKFNDHNLALLPPSSSTPLPAVPSLLELATRKCKFLPDLSEARAWCTSGEGPLTLSLPLSLAQDAIEYGDLECTNPACRRSFIIPRVQWLEWWMLPSKIRPKETSSASPPSIAYEIVPLVRRACSWRCGRDEIAASSQR